MTPVFVVAPSLSSGAGYLDKATLATGNNAQFWGSTEDAPVRAHIQDFRQRPTGKAWRRVGFLVRTCSASALKPDQSSHQPCNGLDVTMGRRRRSGQHSVSLTRSCKHGLGLEDSSSTSFAPLSAFAHDSQPAALDKCARGNCSGSGSSPPFPDLRRVAFLQLVGPSTSRSHAVGSSLLGSYASLLGGLLMAPLLQHAQPQHRLHVEGWDRQSSRGEHVGSKSDVQGGTGAAAFPSPAELHAACLASVTAALVRLPQVVAPESACSASRVQSEWVTAHQESAATTSLASGGLPSASPGLQSGSSMLSTVHGAASPRQSNRGLTEAASCRGAANVDSRSVPTTAALHASRAVTSPKEDVGVEEGKQSAPERPTLLTNPIRYAKFLFAGAMSAVVSRTCVAPLERVKMDLLLRNGTRDALSTALQVFRTEGIAGFWKGNALNVLRTAPFKAVNFCMYDVYHAALLALSGLDGNFERFAAGACAGVTATLVCFPLDVVRTRLLASVAGPRYGSGPFSTLAGILHNEGVAALYSGCLPAVIGMAPAGAVFYGVYDMLKHRHLEALAAAAASEALHSTAPTSEEARSGAQSQLLPQATIAPQYTLLYGAMAGAASELIVYPLEVVRRKMQLQSMALAGMRQIGGMHHMGPSAAAAAATAAAVAASGAAAAITGQAGPGSGPAAAAAAAASAAGGCLAAAAASHHHGPLQLGSQLLPHQALMLLSAAAVSNSPGLARIAAAVTAILRTDGPRGFYSGLLPNMLQVLPSAALSYYTYDTLKTVLGAR